MFNPELIDQLKKNGYLVRSQGSKVTIRTRLNARMITSIWWLLGLICIVYGFFEEEQIGMMGVLLILVPFLHGKFRYPSRIDFNTERSSLQLYYNSGIPENIPFQLVEGIVEDRIIHSTSASPFRKGTQKFIYKYHLNSRDKEYKLLRIESRAEMDQLMHALAVILNQLTRISK